MKKIKIITVLLILLSITFPTFASALKEPELELNYLSVTLGVVVIISIILFNIFLKNKKKKIIINIILLILLTVSIANIIDWKEVRSYRRAVDAQEKHWQYIRDHNLLDGEYTV